MRVKKLLAEADAAEKVGNWDLYDQKLLEAEALERQIYNEPRRGQNIMPLLTSKNLNEVDMLGQSFDDVPGEINQHLLSAKQQGRDGVRFLNLDDAVGLVDKPATHLAVFDPANIRSVNAAFDPAKKESSNLLAGVTGASVLGGGLLGSDMSQADVPHALLGQAEPVKSPLLGNLASKMHQYNRWVESKPGMDWVLPDAPADLFDKWSYGDDITWKDRLAAALGLL